MQLLCLEKVMEEKNDSTDSLYFEDDDLEEESFKISRDSTRHQTAIKSIQNSSKNYRQWRRIKFP